MVDLLQIAKKWQEKWDQSKIFEANPDDRPKFFANIPYPYINAYPHIGHLFTLLRAEVFARYMRMKGYNVLFPQGWHATGSPIINAAIRVKNKEAKQIKIMKDMGFSDEQLIKFEKPEYWIEHFVPEFRKDWKRIGISIDWRREFFTTSLNPHYNKFIEWQFRILKEKGYVGTGRHPVVWCTKCNSAVGDHSRVEGEGESPQEFTLLKFKFDDKYLIAATLRPETVYGQTNLWVRPDAEYTIAKVNQETWVASKEFFEKIIEQEKSVEIIGTIKSNDLFGKMVMAPMIEREVIILPSHFCDPTKGTGIVTSVPSDAPDDWMGLMDLVNNKEECAKYGLSHEQLLAIKPIAIIDSSDLGDMAAKKVCEDMKIKNQRERAKLEEAKKLVYKKGFYQGIMKESCGRYAGLKVEEAKEKVKAELIDRKEADVFYELTGRVVCRCLTPSVVKIVTNQWFLFYGDQDWKKLTHKCLKNMNIYPEKARLQFENVIDWLKHWACTREQGLGTRLPWQDEWVIESLSDSTIYMAYYTIAHKIKDIDVDQIDDNFFDYVFLGKSADLKIDKKLADELRAEFDYWYPFDFRNSGKDLIQNHLTFCLFNHTAIFPEDKWPQGFGVNGWVTVDGQKMSKSLGNMIPLRDMAEEYSADTSRITILLGGESMDDPNWDSEVAKSLSKKLNQFYDFCIENYKKETGLKQDQKERQIDKWIMSEINNIISVATGFMDETLYRSAIHNIFFDLQKKIRWYLRRSGDVINTKTVNNIIEIQVRMLAPFVPHLCEEVWEQIGKKDFISLSEWPKTVGNIDYNLSVAEGIIENTLLDIGNVKKLSKIENPKTIKIFISKDWKYELFNQVSKDVKSGMNQKTIIGSVMNNANLKKYGQDIMKFLPKQLSKQAFPEFISKELEIQTFNDAIDFLKNETKADIIIINADDSSENKANQAMPAKPAIIIE